jgi:hypothetical protein
MFHLLFILALQATGHAQTAIVSPEVFSIGKQWSWTYSSFDKKNAQWTPYFLETYTVVAREGSLVTVEMSSHPTSESGPTPAHHKFIADVNDCLRAANDPQRRNWTVQFYTKSFGLDWELVSRSHPNLVFTEKFNCTGPNGVDVATDTFDTQAIFQILPKAHQDASWYFLNFQGLEGVAARKFFQPGLDYKFEFTNVREGITRNSPPKLSEAPLDRERARRFPSGAGRALGTTPAAAANASSR